MRLYKSYIRPVLEYGAPLILGASKTYIKKLQIIQNKAIRIAYKLDPLSHTEDIHKIANFYKIDLIKDRFQILTYKFIDSLKEHSDLFKLQNELKASRIKRGHKTHLDKLISEYAEIYDENRDCCVNAAKVVSVPVQRQQRWADIDATLTALAAHESDRNSEVLSQCGYRGATVGPALATLSRHWRNAGDADKHS